MSTKKMVVSNINAGRPFQLDGIAYRSFNDFLQEDKSFVSQLKIDERGFYAWKTAKGQLVLEYTCLYPCFDSYDYACENRCHRNYWICKDEAAVVDKLYVIVNELRRFNDDYSNASMPSSLGPALFYDDGTKQLKIGL